MKQYSKQKIATFRERFVELCDGSSMSDTALANALHVSKQTISAWKNGTRSPKEPTIIAIANYFNVCIEWIMGFDVPRVSQEVADQKLNEEESFEEKTKNDDIRLLIRGLNKLSPEQVERAKEMMKLMFDKYFDEEGNEET